jgi:hypothetical protein
LLDRQRHWRAIAGFPLFVSGILILLAWQGISLGDWQAALVLFGVALGFWAVLLTHDDNWWAFIPAGVLTLMGALSGFQARLTEATWLGIFLLGLGAVFGLLYLLRLGQQDTGWAGIPAAAFMLIGLVTLVGALELTGLLAIWWPAALLAAGLMMLILAVRRSETNVPLAPPAPLATNSASQPPAPQPSAPVADLPATPPAPLAPEPPVDIYAVLAQQPKDNPVKE